MKKCIINICFVSLLVCSCFYIWQIQKQSMGILRVFYYFILFLFCGSIVLHLAWTFVKSSIVNDKDVVNETGTLTVY